MALVKAKNRLGRVVVKNEPVKRPATLQGVSPATILETPKVFRKPEPSTEAVLMEWSAAEHTYRPKSTIWFVGLAVVTTLFAGLLVFLGNILGALLVALTGGTIYYIAQHKPKVVQYRIMVDGIAINNRLYPYQDLESFNIKYEPGEVTTVLVRSAKRLSPMINLEIGKADPVAIRKRLLEFLPEDLDMEEPVVDVWARRFGF